MSSSIAYPHIHPDFQHTVALSDRERIEFMDHPRWLNYPAAERLMNDLQSLLHKPAQPRMPNMLIVGDSNNGKTTLVERFFDLCGRGYVNEVAVKPVKPVISVQMPVKPTEKDMYLAILQCFYAPHRPSDTASALRYQVIHLFRQCSVRLLIIDELHTALTGNARQQREVMNTLKYLCNELRIPIVCVGTKAAIPILHTDMQHASRFEVVELPLWEKSKEFQRLLMDIESVLPLHKPSGLREPALANLIHALSLGNLGNVRSLLKQCATDAITSGKEHIDIETLRKFKPERIKKGIRWRKA